MAMPFISKQESVVFPCSVLLHETWSIFSLLLHWHRLRAKVMEQPRTLHAMAEPPRCLTKLFLANVSRSKGWHKHSTAAEEVVLYILPCKGGE